MAKKKTKVEIGDELSNIIDESLNKKFKDMEKVVYNLGEPELSPSDITDWVSTGNDILDLYIANSPNKGLPVGRIVELAGLEASAKSLLCAHILAETQKKDGISYYIDTESAMFRDFFKAVGVDLSKLKYSVFDTLEDIFEAITNVIEVVRKSNSNKLVTIVVDSVAGASTKLEMEDNFDKNGYATGKAIILSKAMRKITNLISKERILLVFTNQFRMKLDAMSFGDPYCVDPFTTKIKIRHKIEEEILLSDFANKFLQLSDFTTPIDIDLKNINIEVLGYNSITHKNEYNTINSFIVKPEVNEYYTDGILKGTSNHRIIENDIEVYLKDHKDFSKISKSMKVVDISVANTENYYANGRLNHNTTSGGKAVGFHSSVRLKMSNVGNIKTSGDIKDVIGSKIEVTVKKNRIGPPLRKMQFEVYFASGIDNYKSWLTVLKDRNLIKVSGSTYTAILPDGREYKFMSRDFANLMETNSELKEFLYKLICDAVILKYDKLTTTLTDPTIVIDDSEIDSETGEILNSDSDK